MSTKRVQKLRQSILFCNTQLAKLKDELEFSDDANIKYNKILIQKAICKKELDSKKESFIKKIIKKLQPKQEKLICDYFKS